MTMTIYDLFLPFFLVIAAYAIWQHNNISMIARYAAKRYCDQEGVQLLDQNVVLRKLSIAPSPNTLLAFRRKYTFEFSSVGDVRYPGHIQLLGQYIENIELSPYKLD